MHAGEAQRAFFWCPGCGYPDAAHWFCGGVAVQSRDELQALWGCAGTLALHSGWLCAFIFLGSSSHGEAFRPPGPGEKAGESGGCFRLSPGRCVVDASLALEHCYLKLAPRPGVPCLPLMGLMAHDVVTLLVDAPCVITVPLGAHPLRYQGRGLWESSLPVERGRVGVCRLSMPASVRGCPRPCGVFDAAFRMSLAAGWPLWGETASTPRLQLATRGPPAGLCPRLLFGPSWSAWFNWFAMTTVQACLPLRSPSAASPRGSSPADSGEADLCTRADGLVRGHRRVGSLFPPRGRAWPPQIKQCRRGCVRLIPVSLDWRYVSRHLVALVVLSKPSMRPPLPRYDGSCWEAARGNSP
jgi:hypothetical protein